MLVITRSHGVTTQKLQIWVIAFIISCRLLTHFVVNCSWGQPLQKPIVNINIIYMCIGTCIFALKCYQVKLLPRTALWHEMKTLQMAMFTHLVKLDLFILLRIRCDTTFWIHMWNIMDLQIQLSNKPMRHYKIGVSVKFNVWKSHFLFIFFWFIKNMLVWCTVDYHTRRSLPFSKMAVQSWSLYFRIQAYNLLQVLIAHRIGLKLKKIWHHISILRHCCVEQMITSWLLQFT
jgi:hypothetical protein